MKYFMSFVILLFSGFAIGQNVSLEGYIYEKGNSAMKYFMSFVILLFSGFVMGQNVSLEGYVFEKGNRGYLNVVHVMVQKTGTNQVVAEAFTDVDGFFAVEVPANTNYTINLTKDMFDSLSIEAKTGAEKTFVKAEMERSPGYLFEITLAEKRDSEDIPVNAINGARIEVYNNTTQEEVMDLKEHADPEFRVNLEKGNHYTILVRKNGYLSKRMEAKVNVFGCILCFEGVGSVSPGVSQNLTEGNEYGVLLANVELERIYEGKTMEIQNLLYDLNKWNLKPAAKEEMNKVITLMKDNPNLTLQLGSHTDSRGNNESNLELSRKRAKAAVKYLIDKGEISKQRISDYGFGESYPLNECVDGVKCTEEQHARNRRTELKIVGITNISEVKSLAQMKKSEEMEGMIEELMNQETIKVTDEKELEEIDKMQEKKQKKITPEEDAARVKRERDALLAKKNEKPTMTTTTESGRRTVTLPEAQGIPASNKELNDGDDMPGLPVVDNPVSKTNGIKIIVVNAPEPISPSHRVYNDFNELEMHITADKRVYYMIGGFETVSDAATYFNKNVSRAYPKAFMASFKDGSMAMINQ